MVVYMCQSSVLGSPRSVLERARGLWWWRGSTGGRPSGNREDRFLDRAFLDFLCIVVWLVV